jgi:hypothetical protein
MTSTYEGASLTPPKIAAALDCRGLGLGVGTGFFEPGDVSILDGSDALATSPGE